MLYSVFRQAREIAGYSQVRLSALSGVSLPTIQNIERDIANPSVATLQALAQVLGLELNLTPRAPDLEKLIAAGLPLSEEAPSRTITSRDLAMALMELCLFLALTKPSEERLIDATHALVFAIHKHYPSWYEANCADAPAIHALLKRKLTGRILKLSRQCYERLARIL